MIKTVSKASKKQWSQIFVLLYLDHKHEILGEIQGGGAMVPVAKQYFH